ncbi:MAG: cytochrome P450 [Actinomycetota bacterium]|nr:cytochrome P450 [Actinomycetota bacterium]
MDIKPVSDWATDFDVADPTYEANPYPIWDELRGTCPVAHTDRRGGAHLPTRYDDIAAVAYDTEHFTSRDVGVLPAVEGSKLLVAPPITSDPPFHTDARRILLPFFSPAAVDRLEKKTRSICEELLDRIAVNPTADAAGDYAQHIPVRVIAHMLGIPESDEAIFTDWAIRIFQGTATDPESGRDATREILAYFEDQVATRRVERAEDLISALIDAELDGAPLTDKHILGSCFLLLMAGIDTTWSGIGASLWHLATHHDDRDRLAADPSLLPTAIEEFLRAYSPVTMARLAVDDTEIAGCPVHAGDRVLLNFPAGNRDPDKFDRPDEVLIDREKNRHFAFGIGIHRCLGSNVARMEMQVAVGAWLERFPTYPLAFAPEVRWGGAQVRGPREVPVALF